MQRKFLLFISTLLLAVFTYTSCTSDKLPEPEPPSECEMLMSSYNNNIKQIVAKSCAISNCHVQGTSVPGDYRTYNGMLSAINSGKIKTRIIDYRDDPEAGMPPDDSNGPSDLSDEEFLIFQCWILDNYPEN